jgi:hypothetical protein
LSVLLFTAAPCSPARTGWFLADPFSGPPGSRRYSTKFNRRWDIPVEFDHVIPYSKGGRSTVENLRLFEEAFKKLQTFAPAAK